MEEKKLNTEKENNIENAIAHEFKVKNELIKKEIHIPREVNSEEKLVKYLCQLNSKM